MRSATMTLRRKKASNQSGAMVFIDRLQQLDCLKEVKGLAGGT
jgi:hypothetical protein